MLLLTGEYQHVVDNKSRILITNKLRNQIDVDKYGGSFYLVLSSNGILCLYPEKLYEQISMSFAPKTAAPDEAVAFERMNFGMTSKVELDNQGRLLINEKLRKRAALKDDITLIGVRDHIELWNSDSWEKYVSENMAQYQKKMSQARLEQQVVLKKQQEEEIKLLELEQE